MKRKKRPPESITVYYDERYNYWVAKESHGHCSKYVKIPDFDEYKPPEGYNGTIIIEGVKNEKR